MTSSAEIVFNPFLLGYTDDPYSHYAQLREWAPVHEHPLGFWMLTRYSDVQELLKADTSVELKNLAPGIYRDRAESLYGDAVTPRLSGLSMLDRDPPTHSRLRALVSKAFTPRKVAALETRIKSLVDEKLDRIAADGGGDAVASLAFPLPFEVISELLGMPDTDHARVRELANLLSYSFEPGVDPELMKQVVAADRELADIVRGVVRWKRDHPADDLMSGLIAAEENGDVLNDDELVAQVELIYLAGYHNTVNTIANGIVALLRRPDQLARLRAEPGLIDNAVDELMRYDTATQFLRRITVRPYQTGDVQIPAGAFVLLGLASANRDGAFWGEDAEQLVLDRPNARLHLAFGSGSRFCLGSALARMEGRLAIGGLVQRFDALALAGEVRWNGRISLRGPEIVPVTV